MCLAALSCSLCAAQLAAAVACPNNCNGHGKCLSLEQAATAVNYRNLLYANTYTAPWDHDKVFGCVCDPSFTGYDCSLRCANPLKAHRRHPPVQPLPHAAVNVRPCRTCPTGDDPETAGGNNEVQTLTCDCQASATCVGSFYLQFQDEVSAQIAAAAVTTVADEDPAVYSLGLGTDESFQAKLQVPRRAAFLACKALRLLS